MARARSADPEPSLFPFLSVLAAVMGTLTLIIAGMSQIALAAPRPRVDVERFDPGKKSAVHVECRADGLLLHPDHEDARESPTLVGWGDIRRDDGEWGALRRRLTHDPGRYLVLLVRADGIAAFHAARETIGDAPIDVAHEPLFGTGEVRFRRRVPR